jgi:hypothetical protein
MLVVTLKNLVMQMMFIKYFATKSDEFHCFWWTHLLDHFRALYRFLQYVALGTRSALES